MKLKRPPPEVRFTPNSGHCEHLGLNYYDFRKSSDSLAKFAACGWLD